MIYVIHKCTDLHVNFTLLGVFYFVFQSGFNNIVQLVGAIKIITCHKYAQILYCIGFGGVLLDITYPY